MLLLYDRPPRIAATVIDHLMALKTMPEATVWSCPVLGDLPPALDLRRFDWIVIHYSVIVSHPYYLTPEARQRLADAPARKAVFIQDEYRHVLRTCAALKELGVSLIFTCCPEPKRVYADNGGLRGVDFKRALTGYLPERLARRRPSSNAARPIDIGYRGRTLPYALGRLGQEKRWIAEAVAPAAKARGMTVDISVRERDRLYGARWDRFLRSCRWVLGTESGASIFDWSGAVESIGAKCASFEEFERLTPGGERANLIDFRPIPMAQVSPRCFEAAALGAAMILYEGDYSGILEPWRHYLPLKKDHSNLAAILDAAATAGVSAETAENAYREIACDSRWYLPNHALDVATTLRAYPLAGVSRPYTASDFADDIRPGARLLAKRQLRALIHAPGCGRAVSWAHEHLPGAELRRRLGRKLIGYHYMASRQ